MRSASFWDQLVAHKLRPNMRLKLSGLLLGESAVAWPGALQWVGRFLAPAHTSPAA
jgi:hypothetical protein